MKIIEFIPQLGSGGGERFTVDLCNELSIRHEVILCLSYPLERFGFYKNELNSKVRVISFNKSNGFDFKLPFKLLRLICQEKPDIVHTHLMAIVYTALSSIIYRSPKYYHTIHNSAKEETDGRIGEILRRFLFRFKRFNAITISPDSLRTFLQFYGSSAPMIANGRNIPENLKLSKEVVDELNSYRISVNTKIVVQLAHLGAQKRQDVMARVVDKLTKEGFDVVLLQIGEIIDEQMAQYIRDLNNSNIHILGGKHNPLEYLKAADAFALCSSYEGLPISLIEALGVGSIPVCTPVGGIVNLIKDGYNGILSEDISEKSYYMAMKRFLSMNINDYEEMMVNVLNSYTPYSMSICASKYEQLFRDAMCNDNRLKDAYQ